MSRATLFLYYNKIPIFNLILGAFILLVPPEVFDYLPDTPAVKYYLGVAMLAAFFLEFSGIWYKSHFIYARNYAKRIKVPIWMQFMLLPRIAASLALGLLAFSGMNWLKVTDFTLVIVVVYATMKEFWVRSSLMSSETEYGMKISPTRVWLGEIFIFIYITLSYYAAWEFWILDSSVLLNRMAFSTNLPFFSIAFLFALITLFLPYLVEEHFRRPKTRIWVYLSFLLPLAAFTFHAYRLGKQMEFFW